MKPVGTVWVNPEVKFTRYFWGPLADITGKPITLLERNSRGDCLCYVHEKGLVDVDHRDIRRYVLLEKDLFGNITSFATGEGGAIVPPIVPIEKFGKDHWSVFAYIETCCVDRTAIDQRRLRCDNDRHPEFAHLRDGEKYPTRLKGYFDHKEDPDYIVHNHDDWDCLHDLEEAGLLSSIGTAMKPQYLLTVKGTIVAGRLRAHKAHRGHFANFEVGSV